jgi:hypothetical protein
VEATATGKVLKTEIVKAKSQGKKVSFSQLEPQPYSLLLRKMAGDEMTFFELSQFRNDRFASLFSAWTAGMKMAARRRVHGARNISFQDNPLL